MENIKQLSIKEKAKSLKSFLKEKKFTLLFIFFLLIIALSLESKFSLKPTPKKTKTIVKQVLVKRSNDPGIIQRALTGKAIDVNTGRIVKAARIFSPDDKTVYLELDLLNAPKGTIIDYIRYKEGRYVDHGELLLEKKDIKNVLFSWVINNLLANIRDGKWRIATYTNGILAKRINYEIKNNKISYVYPETSILPTDPDYKLSKVLFHSQSQ